MSSAIIVPSGSQGEVSYFVKLLMLGDSGVGKSCLMTRFSDGHFPLDIIGTAGIDCKEKIVSVSGKNIRVQIWDTAGQERYSVLTESYYKKAYGIMLVYDTTDPNTFANIGTWMKNIKDKGNAVVEMVVVGNKTDRMDKKVSSESASKTATTYGVPLVEASAKSGMNVEKAFHTLIEKIINNKELEKQCTAGKKDSISISKKQEKGMCES